MDSPNMEHVRSNERSRLLIKFYLKPETRSFTVLVTLSLLSHNNTAGNELISDWNSDSRSVGGRMNAVSHMLTCYEATTWEDMPDSESQACNVNVGIRTVRTRLRTKTSGLGDHSGPRTEKREIRLFSCVTNVSTATGANSMWSLYARCDGGQLKFCIAIRSVARSVDSPNRRLLHWWFFAVGALGRYPVGMGMGLSIQIGLGSMC